MRVRIGRVGKPHGIDGSFFIEQPSDDERWWTPGARFIAGGCVKPRSQVTARRSSGRPVVKLDRGSTAAAPIEVPRDDVPATRTTSTTSSSSSGSR